MGLVLWSTVLTISHTFMGIQGLWGQSVLATGTWHRVAVLEKGIYKLDAAFLRNIGLQPDTFNPQHIQLYSHGGGGALPQSNAVFYPEDPQEQAIYVAGEADGRWDEDDYLLFYGNSADSARYVPATDRYVYRSNPYTDTVYYYLRVGTVPGRRIDALSPVTVSDPAQNPVETIRRYDAYMVHELDKTRLLPSGREVYGETISGEDVSFETPWTTLPQTTVRVYTRAIGRCLSDCELQVSLTRQHTQEFREIRIGPYTRRAWPTELSFEETIATATPLQLTYRMQSSNTTSLAYLDYFLVETPQALRYAEEALFFRTREAYRAAYLRYELEIPREIPAGNAFFLWNVSDPLALQSPAYTHQGPQLSFLAEGGSVQEYVLFRLQDARIPPLVQAIPNQNLKGQAVPQLLILTAEPFFEEAKRLAAFRREHDGLETQVTLVQQIYHEFSSGARDVSAIRNYVRHLYRRDPDKLRYLILFGSCSYDFKNINGHGGNYVPTYESHNSLAPAESYASDDYYGFLEDQEGIWAESRAGDHTLEIGVGRIPVRTREEAQAVVNKLIAYASNPQGPWQRNIHFVTDDGDRNVHHRDAESLSADVNASFPRYEVHKLYLDAYEQEHVQGLQRSAAAAQALSDAIAQGSLIINYTGHGNTQVWTGEYILTPQRIQSLSNSERLPLFITATCDFGRYDVPTQASSGEDLFTYPLGGGIGLFTASRPVFSSTNYEMNEAILEAIYEPTASGEFPRLGDVFRSAKNESLRGVNNRSFILLGDPSMRLAYPRHQIQLTQINNKPLPTDANTYFEDTLKAFSLVELAGEIQNYRGERLENFEGTLRVDVYDKPLVFATRGDQNPVFAYTRWESTLFRGEATIQDGRFRVLYRMPRSMSYRVDVGRLVFYAQPQRAAQGNAAGAYNKVRMGLALENPEPDKDPPRIQAYLNSPDFASGHTVSPKPTLHIRLEDESGIKLSEAGLDKNLSFTLDNNPKLRIDDFYIADKDTYQAGSIQYPLNKLEDGRHTIRIEAWDNYDNSAVYSFHFQVSSHTEIQLRNVKNIPNPFTHETTFCFEHDKKNDSFHVTVEVYDKQGQSVHTQSWRTLGNAGRICNLAWSRTFLPGIRLPADAYIYRLRVYDETDGTTGETSGRLLIRDED